MPHQALKLVLMGLLYYIPILLYSESVKTLDTLGPIVAWPLFMCFIILTSNTWGLAQHEWRGCGKRAGMMVALALVLMLVAVGFLGFGATLA